MARRHTVAEPSAGQEARRRLLAAMPVAERRLELAGVSTAVLEGGSGEPVVLLHGQGEFAAVWLRVVPSLARTHRVIVPDLPGHGASEVFGGAPGADAALAWLAELIDRTCTAPPVLAGHLLGGAIAARLAVSNADRLAHLVLVDTLGLASYRPAPSFALPLVRFLARPSENSRDRLFRRCFVDMDGLSEQVGQDWEWLLAYALDRARAPGRQATLRGLMRRLGTPAIPSRDLARIAVPTTLIHGRHDLQVPLRVAERASSRYRWPLHIIDDAADDPAFEQPEAFLAVMRAVLGDNSISRFHNENGDDR